MCELEILLTLKSFSPEFIYCVQLCEEEASCILFAFALSKYFVHIFNLLQLITVVCPNFSYCYVE